jgi:DNA repair protein RadD
MMIREPEQLGIFDIKTPHFEDKPLKLRPYQEEAINKIMWAQQLPGNDLCVLPTGAGKSVVIAYLAKKLSKPILILQPSKEILEQNYNKLCSVC